MHAWLLEHPPIPTYGICLLLGIIAGWLLARSRAQRHHIDPSHIDLLIPCLVAAGLLGSWAFGRWTDALTPTAQAGEGAVGQGSFVAAGAMIAGTLAGILYALLTRIKLGNLGDTMAAPMALTLAFGRLGCFMAGCCYGKTCDSNPLGHLLGIQFPPGSVAFADEKSLGLLNPQSSTSLQLWPTQLLESSACLLLAILLTLLANRIAKGKGTPGEAFLSFALAYATLRLALEFLRGDNPPILLNLTFSQLTCAAIFTAAAVTWPLRRHFLQNPPQA